ncbi:type II toxin-antitoxin system RelB family antitoxin [Hydrogenimonas sp.]
MHAVKTTFSLPDYIVDELSEFAEELGEKKSHIVAEALHHYFDYLDLKVAQKRSQEIREGKVQTIPLEELEKELGL